MAIQKLPPLLVSQIAAGEVIDRPASVVKELIENSLDAGATRIEITVDDGGRQLIRVSDDACGIPADQLSLAPQPHTTSKLSQPQQLSMIRTMGFRGEALASIASVSRMRITSRARCEGLLAEAGATLEAAGEDITAPTPTGCAPGTTVEVRNLFFNTPARRKFMRAASTEFGHIAETVLRISMVHPPVSFRLTHGSRTCIDTPSGRSRRDRCVQLLGRELDEALLTFEATDPPDTPPGRGGHTAEAVWGLAGIPSIARATSRFQYLYVNGRPIRDRHVAHAIKEAYRGLIPPNKHPLAVVMLQLDPQAVDVNVHPAKSEVRFADGGRVHHLVLSAIRQRLLAADLTPSAAVSSPPADIPQTNPSRPAPGGRPDSSTTGPTPGRGRPVPARPAIATTRFNHPPGANRAALDLNGIRQALADNGEPAAIAADRAMNPTPGDSAQSGGIESGQPADLVEPPAPPPCVLQVHETYLVTQDDQGLIIVDQHALHERVMFEELRGRLLGQTDDKPRTLESQRLLMPAVVKASPRRLSLLDQLKPLTDRIGIEADPIGPETFAIHAFPSFLFDRHVDPVEFFEALLDRAEEGEFDPLPSGGDPAAGEVQVHIQEAVLHKVLDMMACKAAIKAGDRMNDQEMAALLEKRREVERSSACPHGRPTTIRLTLHDMARQFKRT